MSRNESSKLPRLTASELGFLRRAIECKNNGGDPSDWCLPANVHEYLKVAAVRIRQAPTGTSPQTARMRPWPISSGVQQGHPGAVSVTTVWILTSSTDGDGGDIRGVYTDKQVAFGDFLTSVVGLYNDMQITGSVESAVEAYGGDDWVRLTPHQTVDRAEIEGDPIGMVATFIEATARQPLPITDNDPSF